jgi:hypothetical protein
VDSGTGLLVRSVKRLSELPTGRFGRFPYTKRWFGIGSPTQISSHSCQGVKDTPYDLALISEWMEHGTILQFIKNNPETNRLQLVCTSLISTTT